MTDSQMIFVFIAVAAIFIGACIYSKNDPDNVECPRPFKKRYLEAKEIIASQSGQLKQLQKENRALSNELAHTIGELHRTKNHLKEWKDGAVNDQDLKLRNCRIVLEQCRDLLIDPRASKQKENKALTSIKLALSFLPEAQLRDRIEVSDIENMFDKIYPKYGLGQRVKDAIDKDNKMHLGIRTAQIRKPYARESETILVPVGTNMNDKTAIINSELKLEEVAKAFNIMAVGYAQVATVYVNAAGENTAVRDAFVNSMRTGNITPEDLTRAYGAPERLITGKWCYNDKPATNLIGELHDHTGSDPIFEKDCAEADQAANLNFGIDWDAVKDVDVLDEEIISTPHDPTKCPDCQRGEKFYIKYAEGKEEEVDCFTCGGTGLAEEPDTSGEPEKEETVEDTLNSPYVKWWNALDTGTRKRLAKSINRDVVMITLTDVEKLYIADQKHFWHTQALDFWNRLEETERDDIMESNPGFDAGDPDHLIKIYKFETGYDLE